MGPDGYYQATRHPWASLLFVVPLLLVYEGGLWLLAEGPPDMIRSGADTWIRSGLAHAGLIGALWAPGLLLATMLVWAWSRRGDRPRDGFSLSAGMAVESMLFAFGLWGLSRGFLPFLDSLGLQTPGRAGNAADQPPEQLLGYLGAGIYEEAAFRLLLFSTLLALFRFAEIPSRWRVVLAAVVSAIGFALAHNLGSHGEPFDGFVFLFRTLAGVYFAVLFHWRGFGIAVGAHAGYDLLVGALLP